MSQPGGSVLHALRRPLNLLVLAGAVKRTDRAQVTGVPFDNLGKLRLADESPLFTGAEPPRTWRVALRGRW